MDGEGETDGQPVEAPKEADTPQPTEEKSEVQAIEEKSEVQPIEQQTVEEITEAQPVEEITEDKPEDVAKPEIAEETVIEEKHESQTLLTRDSKTEQDIDDEEMGRESVGELADVETVDSKDSSEVGSDLDEGSLEDVKTKDSNEAVVEEEEEQVEEEKFVEENVDFIYPLDTYLEAIKQEPAEEEYHPKPLTIFDILDRPRKLPPPIDITLEHIRQIENELGLIKLCWPKIDTMGYEGLNFPKSYFENSEKEKVLLAYTENFRRQFCYRFPHRKPLFLACENECGMQKMVASTVRPTIVPFPEISHWTETAKFVGDYFTYEILAHPTLMPSRLYSPATVISRQSGNAFELATILVSLLIGFGYDAYVVSGYANKDVTENILIRINSPLEETTEGTEEDKKEEKSSKYTLEPPRDLTSKFLQMVEERKQNKIREQEELKAEQERLALLEIEKRPFDKLEGQRIHAWVLLKPSKDVEESVFIEPSTGFIYGLNADQYLGVESVWNHSNYWVNMQQCTEGIQCIQYDLTDITKWEHLLVGEPINYRHEKRVEIEEEDDEARERTIVLQEKHLDMPISSWGMPITIPHGAISCRFPMGSKTANYKRTIIERFAPYVQSDGLVTRIARYKDFACNNLSSVEERFENRSDKLYKTFLDLNDHKLTEFFDSGREDGVIRHISYNEADNFDDFRIIEYANRYDGLVKIETDMRRLTETFSNREDFLYERHTEFGRRRDGNRRTIVKMVQKFQRNPDVRFSKDIREITYNIANREINVRYHYGPSNITASTRDFLKPPPAEIGEVETFHPELTTAYQAEFGVRQPKMLALFSMLDELMQQEERLMDEIRVVEAKELRAFLEIRHIERLFANLDVSLFNREQNEDNKIAMLKLEAEKKLKQEKEIEEDVDFLSPYLIKYDYLPSLTTEQIEEIKKECLEGYIQLLVDRANRLQKHFEWGSEQLLQKQAHLSMNYDSMTPEEIQQDLDDIQDIMYYLHIMEVRMTRHRELATIRYKNLRTFLDNHEKLQGYVEMYYD